MGRAKAKVGSGAHCGTAEARALHAQCPAIDLHADALMWSRFVGYRLTRAHEPPLPQAWFGGHVDVPRMLQGGIGAQFFGLVSTPLIDLNLNSACHRQIDCLEQAIADSRGQLRLARSAEEIEQAHEQGALAALLGIEGAHCLRGSLLELERFAARGVRYLGLLHFYRNAAGAPARGFGAARGRGLTAFGRELVERCESLGVIVDLAHINARGFWDACEQAKKPLIVSHTGLAGVHPLWRNIDDEQLRSVARLGGVVGVIFVPRYLGRNGIDAVVDHLLHVVRVAGEDVAALGSDWDGMIRPTRGLEDASRLPNLTDALLARNLPQRVIRKILRENVLRVLRDVPPRIDLEQGGCARGNAQGGHAGKVGL
ncbi:MAG: dipeptidase [Proteobacteria bacterium]|nr:dipeptidase [Pseudomonadota bacterium]